MAVVGVQAASAGTHPSCTDSWKARAGGPWATGADWSEGRAPTAADSACITISLRGPVQLNGAASAGALTVGGGAGPDELVLNGGTLTLASTSTIGSTGELATEGYSSVVKVAPGAVFTNHGKVEVGSTLQLSGAVTNAPDGSISVAAPLGIGAGRFVNFGVVLVEANGSVTAPYNGATGAEIYNAAGALEDLGSVTVNKGAAFVEGWGSVTGSPPLIIGGLDLAGKGASQFELRASFLSPTLSGNVAAGQTLLVYGSTQYPVKATGSFLNDGTIFGMGCLRLPAGGTLTNAGMIVVPPGVTFYLAANAENNADGTIAVDGNSPYGANFSLDGDVRLTNDGAIDVGSLNSGFSAGSAGTVFNRTGTISDGGSSGTPFDVPIGATFIEGTGTTTGSPVQVGGALRLKGAGPSTFVFTGSDSKGAELFGNIASDQTVWVNGTSLAPTSAPASFTNFGTLIGNGYLKLPAGATLTNEGTVEVGHGGLGSLGLDLEGNLLNAPSGLIGDEGAGLGMEATGTNFVNRGTVDQLFSDTYDLAAGNPQGSSSRAITYRNTGTVYLGVGGDAGWGGAAGSSNILTYPGDTVDIGGTIVPVPNSEPTSGNPSGTEITYGITGGRFIAGHAMWALSCSAKVTDGWSLNCGNTATLIEHRATTLIPTKISVAGSGTANGNSGWETAYGQPVTLTATVSAQDGSTPTGKVAFFGSVGGPSGSAPAIHPDLLGTATLRSKGGVTSATLTTSDLVPGPYQLLAFYYGDAHHLAASTQYGAPGGPTFGDQTVAAQKTTITLVSSRATSLFGAPVTLTAKVVPAGTGPAQPSGVVTFFDGNTPIGVAPVVTKLGVVSARLTTTILPVGSQSLSAGYSGDYNYGGGTSPTLTQTVRAGSGASA